MSIPDKETVYILWWHIWKSWTAKRHGGSS